MGTADLLTILVINPGSTSTKLALFSVDPITVTPPEEIESASLEAAPTALESSSVAESMQREVTARLPGIEEFAGHAVRIDCIAARGGLVKPVRAGSYFVDEAMIDDLIECRFGRHASNLGAPLAAELADRHGCPAIIADPVGVDEFEDVARFSGFRGIERRSFSHALNLRAVARRASSQIGKPPAQCRFVGVHLGGGISVAAMIGGRIVDVNNSNEGGPFTPQRAGSLPILQLIDLCFSDAYPDAESLKRELTTAGGLVSYLGTSSVEGVLARIDRGDEEARRVLDAMVYQITKEIGATAAVLRGDVDAVFLTGGFARPPVSRWISERVGWIAPVLTFPGEGELEALAEAAARFLRGTETPKRY